MQIAVRLPDELVAYLDQQVTSGAAPSRAAVVARSLERERRRLAAENDAKIYAANGPHDLDELTVWTTSHPIALD